jgi:hypothetical protein
MRHFAIALGTLLAVGTSTAVAQAVSEGTLVVQQGGKEIGREDVVVRRGTPASGAEGTTITVNARYPASSPATRIEASLDRNAAGEMEKFLLRGDTPEGPTQASAAGAGARLIIKTAARAGETGREVPGGPDVVVLDPNVYALYGVIAELATADGRRLTAVYPRTNRRARFTARREGNRVSLTGEITGTITVDAEGRVQRIELPGDNIVVVRAPR